MSGKPQSSLQTSPSRREAARREQAQHDSPSLVSFGNGKAPARSSRAAQEWYGRRPARGPFTRWVPLCAPLRGFFSINAILTGDSLSPGRENVKAEFAGTADAPIEEIFIFP